MPNWAEQVTAVATVVSAVGWLSAVGAALFAAQQVREVEQLGALERVGGVNFELVRLLLGRRLTERWEMWKPSVDALGEDVYPMFAGLVAKMRTELAA